VAAQLLTRLDDPKSAALLGDVLVTGIVTIGPRRLAAMR
jgi:hypothetical protein